MDSILTRTSSHSLPIFASDLPSMPSAFNDPLDADSLFPITRVASLNTTSLKSELSLPSSSPFFSASNTLPSQQVAEFGVSARRTRTALEVFDDTFGNLHGSFQHIPSFDPNQGSLHSSQDPNAMSPPVHLRSVAPSAVQTKIGSVTTTTTNSIPSIPSTTSASNPDRRAQIVLASRRAAATVRQQQPSASLPQQPSPSLHSQYPSSNTSSSDSDQDMDTTPTSHISQRRKLNPSSNASVNSNGNEEEDPESKRRRLARKAELARLSRQNKKTRMAELEEEVAMLKEQLEACRREMRQASGIPALRSDEIQVALQQVMNSIAPALLALSNQTHIPVSLPSLPPNHK